VGDQEVERERRPAPLSPRRELDELGLAGVPENVVVVQA
jgi:hypothetical protein